MKRLLPLLFACSAAAPTVGDYERATLSALCHYYSLCGVFSASQEASCDRVLAAQVEAGKSVYSVDEALAAGRLVFDPAAAQACTASVAAAHCDTESRLALGEVFVNPQTGAAVLLDPYTLTNAPCAGVLKGRVAPGGSCKADGECVAGWCDNHDVPGCLGTCTPFATGDCTGQRCPPGDYCDPGQNRCVALAAPVTHALGEGCTVQYGLDDCDLGLYCDPTHVCADRLTAGVVCSSPSQCADGLWCSSGGVCTPFSDIGQACDVCAGDAACVAQKCALVGQAGDDCGTLACAYNLYCNAQNRCASEMPPGALVCS